MEYSIDLDENTAIAINELALSFSYSLLSSGRNVEPNELSNLAMDYAIEWYKAQDSRPKKLSLAFPLWTDIRLVENHELVNEADKCNFYWYVSDCETPNNKEKYIVKRGKFISRTQDNFYFGEIENGSYREIPNKAVFVLLDENLNKGDDIPSLPQELKCLNDIFPPKK